MSHKSSLTVNGHDSIKQQKWFAAKQLEQISEIDVTIIGPDFVSILRRNEKDNKIYLLQYNLDLMEQEDKMLFE